MIYCTDSWFIIAAFNKDEKGVQLLRETKGGKTRLVIPMVVFAEATKKLMQRGTPKEAIDLFWAGVEASEKVTLIPLDRPIAEEAAKISLSFKLPLIDALIAATCKLTGCNALLTGDQDYRFLVKHRYLDVVGW